MESHSEEARSAPSSNDGLPRVLIIDDSVSVRIALERILWQRPVEVLAVSNGMDGIGAMLEHAPVAVICDYVLPDRDGITLARFVRNHPLLCKVPFFLISGAADAALEEQALESGCTAVFHKPFTPEAVLAALDRHVGSRLSPRPAAAPPAPEEPASARILVIDDSMSVRVALERLLVQRGYETTAVASSAEGLRRLNQGGAFDLLISDIVMPDMDGIELVRFIRESPALRSLPVILVSGLGDTEVEEKARAVGVDDVVRKPFTAGSLIPKVERILARARKAPAPPSSLSLPESGTKAALRVLRQLNSVAGVEGALLLDRRTGKVIATNGIEVEQASTAAAHVVSLIPLLLELGAGVSRSGLCSGILQYRNGFLLLYEAGELTILVSLSDAGQLGLLNLLVQKKLPRILAGDQA
jgi:CheY-like chemotaxis protein/predicted regulator of Ras-like GTPase activity (Roadblock/LC7/MglB family)